jgi:Ser/Thr protein kinase RdoA (MazF antagonist)
LKPLSNYKELEEALWQGYTSKRPLTNRHRELLEIFIAARQVASMRWVAANQHNPAYQGKVEAILQQRTAELAGFLETGILNRS